MMALKLMAVCEICGKVEDVKKIKKNDRHLATDGWVARNGQPADLKDEALRAPFACPKCAKTEEFERRKLGSTKAFEEGWYGG